MRVVSNDMTLLNLFEWFPKMALTSFETRQRANSFSVKVFNCTFAPYKMDGKITVRFPLILVNKYLHLNSIKLFNKSVILSPSWYTSITIIP